MKKVIVLATAILLTISGLYAQNKGGKKDSTRHVYTCPMHPDVTSDKPGKCPKCGMTLVEKKSPAAPKPKRQKKDSTMKMN